MRTLKIFSFFYLAVFVAVVCLVIPAVAFAQEKVNCLADLDCDGDVDASDLGVFASEFGETNCADCIIDLGEYKGNKLTKNFNIEIYSSSQESIINDSSTREWNEDVETTTVRDSEGIILNVTERHFIDIDGCLALEKKRYFEPPGTLCYERLYDPPIFRPYYGTTITRRINQEWVEYATSQYISYYNGQSSTGMGIYSEMFTITKIEDVTVPAGTFQDCVKLVINDSWGYICIFWLAKGIGTVKYIENYRNEGKKIELLSYQTSESSAIDLSSSPANGQNE